MKNELISNINIKIAISLNRLLDTKKNLFEVKGSEEEVTRSYNEIALRSDIRKATVSDTFNAKTKSGPNSTTLILIIETMGYNLTDFATLYDSITEVEIAEFKKLHDI